MNAIGASILTILLLVVLLAPRRAAMLGLMAGALYLTYAQQVYVLGFNMFALRFLELAGFSRVIARGEYSFARLNKIDRSLLLLYSFSAIVYTLRSTEGQAYVIGNAVDVCLCYFTFRGLVADAEEFRWFLRAFVVLLAPFAVLVLIESLTRYNVFSIMGGGAFAWEREGRLRCIGSFRHPDLLGTLGASFLPLYIGLACGKMDRMRGVVAIGLCLVIVWCSNSGGPACAVSIGMVGWMCWKIRTNMRLVRWGIVGAILLAAVLMKAPVWALFARASSITGGDGWHRSYLMDVSYRHLNEWWFAGLPIIKTADWFPYIQASNGGGADITNTFIAFGLTAGLGAVALFILLLTRAFSALGKALAIVRHAGGPQPSEVEFILWGLGAMLAAHISNWLGITYFDQTSMIWFMQLAAISSLSESCLETSPKIDTNETEGWPEDDVLNGAEVQYEKELQ
jgi:hypothetical protein